LSYRERQREKTFRWMESSGPAEQASPKRGTYYLHRLCRRPDPQFRRRRIVEQSKAIEGGTINNARGLRGRGHQKAKKKGGFIAARPNGNIGWNVLYRPTRRNRVESAEGASTVKGACLHCSTQGRRRRLKSLVTTLIGRPGFDRRTGPLENKNDRSSLEALTNRSG